MRFRPRRRIAVVVAAIGAVVFVATTVPVAAHSEVRARSPAAGQIVGGTVDRVEIQFFVPVSDAEITLFGPGGSSVTASGSGLDIEGTVSWIEFDRLDVAGTYTVEHRETADDGDVQTATFEFRYDPDSSVERTPILLIEDGPNWLLLGGIAAIVLALVALFAPRPRRRSEA